MNIRQIERMREQASMRCEQAVSAAKAKLQEELSGLDVVERMMREQEGGNGVSPRKRSTVFTGNIKDAVTLCPRQFTVHNVVEHMPLTHEGAKQNLKSVANAVDRLADDGTSGIRRVTRGVGRKPTLYEKAQDVLEQVIDHELVQI